MKYVEFQRTPIKVADDIKDLIKGKKVIDVGAGDGSFVMAMRTYADEVDGIEIDRGIPSRTSLEYGDFMKKDLSEYDVIFTFLNFFGMSALNTKLENWSGTLISYYYPLHETLASIREPDRVIKSERGIPILIYDL